VASDIEKERELENRQAPTAPILAMTFPSANSLPVASGCNGNK